VPWFCRHDASPCVPSIATLAPFVGRSERHRPRHPCTPAPLLTVLALPRCQTQLFDFCNTMNDTRARLRSDARHPRPHFGLTLRAFTTIRLGEPLQRATRLDPDASHCLEAAPSEEEDPGPRTVSSLGRAGAERTDEARVKVKSVQFPGGPDSVLGFPGWALGALRIPWRACALLVPSRCRIEPLVSPTAGAIQDGACIFARLRPRPTFPHHPAKGGAFGLTEVLVTVRNEHTAGIAPSSARRASRSRRPRERVLQAGETAPFVSSLASPRIDVRSGGGRLDEWVSGVSPR